MSEPTQPIPTKPEVSSLRLVLTLALAGTVAGLLLVFVHQLTAPAIAAHKQFVLEESIGEVLGDEGVAVVSLPVAGPLRLGGGMRMRYQQVREVNAVELLPTCEFDEHEVERGEGVGLVVGGEGDEPADAVEVDSAEDVLGEDSAVVGREAGEARLADVVVVRVGEGDLDALLLEALGHLTRPGNLLECTLTQGFAFCLEDPFVPEQLVTLFT